jgi:predicted SAM-dependent methyltransferase
MRLASILKRLVVRRSTRVALRDLQRAARNAWSDLVNEARHGRALAAHCRGKDDILLHAGSGSFIQPEWVNFDVEQIGPGAFYFNAVNALPLSNGSVTHIHAEHFLEHLDYDDALSFLRECYRILRDGGTMRIIVPDAEKYMRAYAADDLAFFQQLNRLGGSADVLPTKGAICNQMFRMGGAHKFAWDFETLQYALAMAGFRQIQKSFYKDASVTHMIDGSDLWRPLESLYVNATK